MDDSLLSDPVRELVAATIADKNLEMAEVSKALGRNHAYIFQFLKAGKPRELPEKVRESLAILLGIPESRLRLAEPSPRDLTPLRPRPNATLGPQVALGATGERIPMYGQAIGGADGKFILNGNMIGMVLAPPSLIGVHDAYAVLIAGESMVPRYQAGETAYVHPRLPVRREDYVVVQVRGDEDDDTPFAYVKQFISMDERRLKLRQLNPAKDMEFPRKDVLTIHRIVLSGD